MSRMGKQPIDLGDKVKVEVADGVATVSGPKGQRTFTLPECIALSQDAGRLVVSLEAPESSNARKLRELKAIHGMARSLLQGLVTGVSDGFTRKLEFQGVGYRGQVQGQKLTLNLGYSHPVEYSVPENVTVTMPDQTHIVLESVDKQTMGQVAATIRGFRPPDAYKGKGIRYEGEQISLKEGKTVG